MWRIKAAPPESRARSDFIMRYSVVCLAYLAITQLLIKVAVSELGNVDHGLVYHLSKCMISHKHIKETKTLYAAGNNVIHVLQQVSLCWETTLQRCNDYLKQSSVSYIIKEKMCGVFNTGMQITPSQVWSLKVYPRFGIHITFVEFHLPCSMICAQGHVRLAAMRSGRDVTAYCGKRAPWTISYRENHMVFFVRTGRGQAIPYGFYFKLLYEAIDVESPFIVKMYKQLIIGESRYKFYYYDRSAMSGNRYTIPPQPIKHTYHFMTSMLQVTCIQLSRNRDMKLYDGPGPLSRVMNITNKALNKTCFSRYMGYAEISHHNGSLADITYWVEKAESVSFGLCQNSSDNGSLHFQARDTGSGVHCIWTLNHQLDEMLIHHVSYQGYDMLSFVSYYKLIREVEICQYGGLHMLFEEARTGKISDPFPLCNKIYNKPKILMPLRQKVKCTYVIFSSFDKYSTGQMEMSLKRFPECELFTVNFFDCDNDGLDYRNTLYYYSDGKKLRDIYFREHSENIPHCKSFWILNNLGNRAYIPSTCSLTFKHDPRVSLYVEGTHKATIYNWIIPQTQHMERPDDYYSFIMNATGPKDFPLDMTMVQNRTVVPRDNVVDVFLPHLLEFAFYTNHSLTDLHATVVQIQFHQNRACYRPRKRQETIPWNVEQLFFDELALQDEAIAFWDPTKGKNYCSFLLKGELCRPDETTQADIILDHGSYRIYNQALFEKKGYRDLYFQSDIRLNISIHNDTQHCSDACQLDVTIWENLMFTPKAVPMLKWENVRTLIWRVPTTQAGFRLHMQQNCSSPCVQMCDVVVYITVYEEQFNCMKPHKDFSGEISDEVMGNWNDANAYCEQKGMQLSSIYTDDYTYDNELPNDDNIPVDDIRKLVCSITQQQEGLQLQELTVFVGLFKPTQVSLCS